MTFQEDRNRKMRRGQWLAALLVPLSLFLSSQWGQGIGLPAFVIGLIWIVVSGRRHMKCPHCGSPSYRPYPGGLFAQWLVLKHCSACGKEYEPIPEAGNPQED